MTEEKKNKSTNTESNAEVEDTVTAGTQSETTESDAQSETGTQDTTSEQSKREEPEVSTTSNDSTVSTEAAAVQQQASSQESEPEKKDKKKKYLLLLLLFLALAGISTYTYITYFDKEPPQLERPENETKLEKIKQTDKDALQKSVNDIVEKGYMNVNFTPYATFDTAGKSLDFTLRNSELNHYPIKFEITDANDKVIYKSVEIPIGYEVEEIELKEIPSIGVHKGYTVKIGYTGEGNVTSAFPLTINVQ